MDSLALGEIVRSARSRKGWSARHLSDVCGLSPAYVSRLEAGGLSNPSLSALSALADALDFTTVEIAWIVRTARD